MIKKLLKISLITIILILFGASFCFAIATPDQFSPTSGETNVSLSPTFQWKYISGATYYGLHYMKQGDPVWRYIHVDAPATPPSDGKVSYQATGLTPKESYLWQVQSCNPNTCSSWSSPPLSFQTQELGPLPDGGDGDGTPIGLINPLKATTLEEAINALINFLFYLAMGIAPILIIYAAFLILTAGGDAAKISRARTIILWTLIAVAIVLFAKGLPVVIKGALGG